MFEVYVYINLWIFFFSFSFLSFFFFGVGVCVGGVGLDYVKSFMEGEKLRDKHFDTVPYYNIYMYILIYIELVHFFWR